MPNSRHPHQSRGHSAGFLTFEAVVTYPFHPLRGQTVLVVGDHQHDGTRYFLIGDSQDHSRQIPAWMFESANSHVSIVSAPRFPLSQLVLLRSLVDRLVSRPSDHGGPEGIGHEKVLPIAKRPVRQAEPVDRPGRPRSGESVTTAAAAIDGSVDQPDNSAVHLQRKGGRV